MKRELRVQVGSSTRIYLPCGFTFRLSYCQGISVSQWMRLLETSDVLNTSAPVKLWIMELLTR
jgi:hypothetical protein